MNCPKCNGAGWKRYGFLHLRSKRCPDCGGTGRDKKSSNWPPHAMIGKLDKEHPLVAVDVQNSFLTGDGSTPLPSQLRCKHQKGSTEPFDRYSQFRPDDQDNADPLMAAIAAEALGGDGLTAAIATEITGNTELGILAGALDQDDSEHHLDSDDHERGESSERDDSNDHDDDHDTDDHSDSDSCGSND